MIWLVNLQQYYGQSLAIERIQNLNQHAAELQQRKFADELQKHAVEVKTEVQSSHKAENIAIKTEDEQKHGGKNNKDNTKNPEKKNKGSSEDDDSPKESRHIIDIIV